MPTCFVIQPFDEKNDRRYEEVYKPALQDAAVTPYRVDRDPSVAVPIDSIENTIKKSDIFLADITTHNPNVWYELGFASATGRPVVMICEGAAFTKLPFDIQHRLVVQYSTSSPTDFERLRKDVTNRIVARLNDATPSAPDADTGAAQESSHQLSQKAEDILKAAALAPAGRDEAQREGWEAEKAGYIRQNVGRAGEIAYRPKSPKPGTDHLLCANCFEDGRKSYLQSRGVKWKCPRCPTSISRG